jgi:membrane protease YdiL (CAAX protease family)
MDEEEGSDTVYCTSCGEQLDPSTNFCRYCGEPLQPLDDSERPEREDAWAGGPPPERGVDAPGESPDPQPEPGAPVSPRDRYRQKRNESPFWTVLVASSLGVGGVVFLILFSIPVVLVSNELGVSELVVLAVGTGIGQYVSFVGLGLLYLRRREFDWGRIRSYLGIRVPTLRELGIVILGYVAIFVLILIVGAIVQAVGTEPAENQGAESLTGTTNPAVLLGAILMMFLVVGPCEEVLYRGIVQNRLRERLDLIPAIVIASVVFAAVHFVVLAPGTTFTRKLTTIGILFVPAIVLGVVYEYTGNLVVPALLHGIHNSVIIFISFFAPEMQENAEFISAVLAVFGV